MAKPGNTPDQQFALAERAMLDAFISVMPDAVVAVDRGGMIVAMNELAEALFCHDARQVVGRPVEILIPERHRSAHVANRDGFSAQPESRPMGAGIELWARRADGTEFPVDIALSSVGGPDGSLILASVRDLTERRAAWEAMARLGAIVSSSEDAIISVTPDGTVTSWNPSAERLFGATEEEMIGVPAWRPLTSDARHEMEELLARVRHGTAAPALDARWSRKDGTPVDVSVTVSPIRGPSGDTVGFSALARDITDRKRAEEELRHLLGEVLRRERWLEALGEIQFSLLSEVSLEETFGLICHKVMELADADDAAILVPGAAAGTMRVSAAAGPSLGDLVGTDVPVDAPDRSPADDPPGGELPDGYGAGNAGGGVPWTRLEKDLGLDPAACVPLFAGGDAEGALVLGRMAGRPAFDSQEDDLIGQFALHAGMAMQLTAARKDRARLSLIGDRERIARDLHDHVIQRIFATGMTLQSVRSAALDERLATKIENVVEELDQTIGEIRSTIFSLETRDRDGGVAGIRSRILDLAGQAQANLGFRPDVHFDGPVDSVVTDDLAHHVLAVAREGLSNATRHARATWVGLMLAVDDGGVTLTVSDNGCGIGDSTRVSGLGNLRRRAQERDGTFVVDSSAEKGTTLTWRVPAPR